VSDKTTSGFLSLEKVWQHEIVQSVAQT